MVVPGHPQPLPGDVCPAAGTAVCMVCPQGGSPMGFSDGRGGDLGTLSRSCHRAPRGLWGSSAPDSVKIEVHICKALFVLQVLHRVLTRAL